MKIAVVGGSGFIGTKLVIKLRAAGHQVVAASPTFGVDSVTRNGLTEALRDAEVVVDVTNSSRFDAQTSMDFFVSSGKNLMEEEKRCGVKHHIVLSVVGTSQLQESGYMKAKLVQEELVIASGIPFTILHATQFFEFVETLAAWGAKAGGIHLPDVLVQPISADEVVQYLGELVLAEPVNGIIELAGPDKIEMREMVGAYMSIKKDTREVVADILSTYFGAKIDNQSLLPASTAKLGKVSFDKWIRQPENLQTIKKPALGTH